MDHAVVPARGPVSGTFQVPASKSMLQRLMALAVLSEGSGRIATGSETRGEDVARFFRATQALGRWSGGALGSSRRSLALDLGLGATGFRLATALATLRPAGARTLVRGRPPLLARPHRDLRRALTRLGGHVRRRPSGALRVIAGGLAQDARLTVGCRRSSQHLTALMLIAPRLGGLTLTLVDRPVSRPYLELTLQALASFGIAARAEGLDAPGGTLRVEGGAPRAEGVVRVEADASAAAVWWAAAALTAGAVEVPGLAPDSRQADVALLGLLVRMGAAVSRAETGDARVEGPAAGLVAAGVVDLCDAPDLLPLAAVLAASARGTTRLVGVVHARVKESDRIATTAAALGALGGRVRVLDDGLEIEGGPLVGGRVDVAGDHRLAFAFGALGLVVPGVVLAGAQAAGKSHPRFLEDLGRAASG